MSRSARTRGELAHCGLHGSPLEQGLSSERSLSFFSWDILCPRIDVDYCEKYTCLQVILSMTCVSVVSHLMEPCRVMLP